MNAGVQNFVISLGAMQIARKIAFDDPDVLTYVRIGYVVAQLIALGAYYYVSMVIKKKNGQTVLKYVEPSAMPQDQKGELVTTTVRDYHLSETSKLLRSAYMGIAMIGVVHFYFHFTQPLFVQTLMGVKNLYDAKPVAIHTANPPLATSSVHSRQRECSVVRSSASFLPSSLANLSHNYWPQTDAAAIAETEQQVGKKEE